MSTFKILSDDEIDDYFGNGTLQADEVKRLNAHILVLRAESEARRVALEEAIRYVKAHPSEDNWDENFLQKYGDK